MLHPVPNNIAYNIDAIKIFNIIYGFPCHSYSPDKTFPLQRIKIPWVPAVKFSIQPAILHYQNHIICNINCISLMTNFKT